MKLLPFFLIVGANLTEKSPGCLLTALTGHPVPSKCPLPNSSAPTAHLSAVDRDELIEGLLSMEQVACGSAYHSTKGGEPRLAPLGCPTLGRNICVMATFLTLSTGGTTEGRLLGLDYSVARPLTTDARLFHSCL